MTVMRSCDRNAATACAARALAMAALHGEVSGCVEAASVVRDAEFRAGDGSDLKITGQAASGA